MVDFVCIHVHKYKVSSLFGKIISGNIIRTKMRFFYSDATCVLLNSRTLAWINGPSDSPLHNELDVEGSGKNRARDG